MGKPGQGQQGRDQAGNDPSLERGRPSGSPTAGKSDDEILAEALKLFEKGNDGDQSQAGDSQQGSMTEGERNGQLDGELDQQFAKFDELMQDERDKVAQRDNRDGVRDYGSGDFGDSEGDGEDPLQTALLDDAPPAPENPSESQSGESGPMGAKPSATSRPPPPDLADDSNDDVIARQLREAALKEQDPELRARLWDEYRKYKGGAA